MNILPRQILLSYLPQAGLFLFMPLTIKLLTNNLTPAEYGGYVLINNLANYCMFIAGLGMHRYMARSVPGSSEEQQYSVFVKALIIEIAMYILLLGILLLFISPLFKALNMYEYRFTALYFLCGYMFYFIYNEALRFIGFQKRLGTKSVLNMFEKPLLLAALLGLVIWHGHLNLHTIFSTYIIVFAVLFLAVAMVLKWRYFGKWRSTHAVSNIKSMALWLPSLFLIDLLFKTMTILPRYFLSKYAGNESVGLYALSDNLVRVFYLFVTPFIFILYPYIAEQLRFGREQKRIKSHATAISLLRVSFNITLYIYLALVVILLHYGRECIVLLSREEFTGAVKYLPYFALNYLLVMFLAISHPLLILLYDMRKLWLVYGIFLVANILLSYLLISNLKEEGAILCMIITNAAISIYVMVLLKTYLRRMVSFRGGVMLAGYSIALVVIVLAIKTWLDVPVVLKIAVTTILVAGMCVAARRKDITFLRHLRVDSRHVPENSN